jgi:hypothetical protein
MACFILRYRAGGFVKGSSQEVSILLEFAHR